MPGVLVPLDYVQSKLVWTLAGDNEPMISTIGWENPNDVDLQTFANYIHTNWLSNAVPGTLSSAWTFQRVEVQAGTATGTGGAVAISTGAPSVGTASQAAMPQNVAMLIHKRTPFSGRRGRGRMYLPGGYLQENAVDPAGGVLASLITSFNTVLSGFMADMAVDTGQPALFHDQLVPGPYPITSLTVDTRIATQRRRLRK